MTRMSMSVKMEIPQLYSPLFTQQDCSFDDVTEFSYIARPRIRLECLDAVRLEPNLSTTKIGAKLFQHVICQNWYVLNAFTQRWKRERYRAHSEVKIVAEFPLANQLPEILMSGSDQTNINFPIADVTDSSETLISQAL